MAAEEILQQNGQDGPGIGASARPARSLRSAIDAKCKDCIYDELEPGNWRQQAHACTVTSCPLHLHRPRSSSPLPGSPR